jgi:hypothetical protein
MELVLTKVSCRDDVTFTGFTDLSNRNMFVAGIILYYVIFQGELPQTNSM